MDSRDVRQLRAVAALMCAMACAAVVCMLAPQQHGAETLLSGRACGMGKDCAMSGLDGRLNKILQAENTAAGAIEVLWRETNQMPEVRSDASERRDGPRIGTLRGDDNIGSTWSAKMAKYLERLNEMALPEAEQIAPSNLDLHLDEGDDLTVSPNGGKPRGRKTVTAPLENAAVPTEAAARTQSAPSTSSMAPAPLSPVMAVSAIRAEAAARVRHVLDSVKKPDAGTQQLVVKPVASFFKDAVRNLAAAKKSSARLHLKARTMMLADSTAPEEGGEEEQAAETKMAVEDAEADGNMGKEVLLGDALQGHWHAPMWPHGDDEGSAVLTSTIAAPGQGGEYAYGFPYDEAKMFSLADGTGGNTTGASAAEAGAAAGEGGEAGQGSEGTATDDVVEAAEEEAADEGKPGAQSATTPFYEGVGAGAQLGPKSQGGWDGKSLPPAMPGDSEREAWLQERANGYSDEFSGAVKSIEAARREKAMARENSQDEAMDGEVSAIEDTHIAQLRQNIAKFVGAMEHDGVVESSQGNYALTRLEQEQPKPHVLKPKDEGAQAVAMPGAAQMLEESGVKAGDGELSDAQFLQQFKPPSVDDGEDFPCGWPGPPCADPAGESAGGGFLGGGSSDQFWGMRAKSAGNAAELQVQGSRASGSHAGGSGAAAAVPAASRYSELASSLLAPLRFGGRSEKNNADEAAPKLR